MNGLMVLLKTIFCGEAITTCITSVPDVSMAGIVMSIKVAPVLRFETTFRIYTFI